MIAWSYGSALLDLSGRWINEPDYSHGFFVPVFAAFLLWHRRTMLLPRPASGSWWGLAFLGLAAGMRWASAYLYYLLLDPLSLLPCLAGIVLLLGGWKALQWAWPAILFLVFMIPLPSALATLLSHPLQRIATIASTYTLQTLGVPAIARGNVIWLTDGKIGVVEACSGLRMLMLFSALTIGAALLVRKPLWEKAVIAMSALAIGILANIVRIAATAVLHELVGPELADKVFHDLAGWLMMPIATALLGLELFVLSKLFVVPRRQGPLLVRR